MRALRWSIAFVLLYAGAAFAEFPERPVTLIVGYDVGSVGDQTARGLAEALRKYLGQPLEVVNRPGQSGTLAIAEALKAPPDGYTLAMGTIGNLAVQPHRMKLPYGGPETYTPIAKLVTQPNVLMVRANAPWKTARELLEYARANPGKVTVGVPGVATVAHLNLEQLKRASGVDMRAAFFDGPKQVRAALDGEVDAAIAGPGPIMPHVKSGAGVALGIFDERRLPLSRDMPTFKELGFDVTMATIQAIVGPPGMPAPVVARLNEAIHKAVQEPSFVALGQKTQNPIDYLGPDELRATLAKSYEENGKLVRILGLAR